MRQMKPESARALTWFAAILMVVGWLVMSPGGAFFFFVLSALFAVAPAIFGATKIRLTALALLIMAIFFAVDRYPGFKNEQERLRQHKVGFQQMPHITVSCLGRVADDESKV